MACPQLLDSPVAVDYCRDELLSAARDLFAGCQHVDGRHIDRWRNLTKATLERAMSCPDRLLPIAELAHACGIRIIPGLVIGLCLLFSPVAPIQRMVRERFINIDTTPTAMVLENLRFAINPGAVLDTKGDLKYNDGLEHEKRALSLLDRMVMTI
jgi:hypothetical protein